jgi:hypothetical protein
MSGDKLVQGQNSDLSFEEVGEDAVAPVVLIAYEPNDCLWIWVLRCDCCGECNCRGVDGWRDSMIEASVVLALDTAAVLLVLQWGCCVWAGALAVALVVRGQWRKWLLKPVVLPLR